MKHPYEPLMQFCRESERLNPRSNPFSPGILEYVTATLKLFLADKEQSLDNVFKVKQNYDVRRKFSISYKPARIGMEARIAFRASRLKASGKMTWKQIADQVGYSDPKKLSKLVDEFAEKIEEANNRTTL